MRKRTGIWLAVATLLTIGGLVLFAASMTANRWDFTKLSTVAYETNTYPISEEFSGIWIETDTADILLTISNDGTCKVICHEAENLTHRVAVEDGILTVHCVDERTWMDYIGITVGTPKITVCLPQEQYTSLSIKESTGDVKIGSNFRFETAEITTSTGSISMEHISAGTVTLSVSTGRVTASDISCTGDMTVRVSTGKVKLSNIHCKRLTSDGDTGDISLTNVIATERFSIERTTGDVTLDGCDAAEIFIQTDTGDVVGSLLSDKVFIVQTDTGKIDIPLTATGGHCEITTDTGDIKVTIN